MRAGTAPPCEYPTVVTARNYELLLFGGSQQGIADSGRGQAGNAVTDMLWHCRPIGGDWRSVAADDPLPGAVLGTRLSCMMVRYRTSTF